MNRLKEICIEVIYRCPNDCKHCSSSASMTSSKDIMSLNEIMQIIDGFYKMNNNLLLDTDKDISSEKNAWIAYNISQLPLEENKSFIEWKKKWEKESLKLSELEENKPVVELSGGEPLIRKDIIEIMQYIKEKGLRLLIYTSGFTRTNNNKIVGLADNSELLDELSKILRKEDGDGIILSLEGSKEETHDGITQHPGSFRVVDNAIKALKSQKINVEIHCTPMKLNFREIPELIDIATKEYRIENISFLRLVPQGRALEYYDEIMLKPKEFKELIEILYNEWLKTTKESNGTKIRLGCPIDFRHLLYPVKRKPCHGGRDQILIRPDGEIHPCPAWKEINHMSLGNIRNNISLQQAWLNSETINLFRSYSANNLWGDCHYCPHGTDICAGGCPAQRIIANMERGIKNKEAQLRVGPDPLCFKHFL